MVFGVGGLVLKISLVWDVERVGGYWSMDGRKVTRSLIGEWVSDVEWLVSEYV